MTRQDEDTLYIIHTELTESGLWPKFNKELRKINEQGKHKWKPVSEKWELALNKIKQQKK